MTIYNLDFVKELVNAFNVSNYGSKVNTNFVVEGDNIVVKFNCGKSSAKRYLSQMARDLVREYYSNESVARYAFDLGSLPFNFKGKWTSSKAGTQLTVPIDSGVIFNLKVHFAEEFKIDVKNQVIKAIDEKCHLGKKRIEEALNKSVNQVKMDPSSGYIKCLLFHDTNVQKYFVRALQEQMKKHGCDYLGFYDIDDNKIYFKDVENIGFVRSVTELSKKMAGYNFNFPSDSDLKVRSYKNAMSWLIFSLTGTPIHRYYYDEFIDKDRISNGDHFAFIPITKDGSNFRYLNYIEADKINAKFSHDILTNIRGQTKDTESNEFGEVYAFSNRQIALLIPVIIENSVINKDGQIEIDPELPRTLLAEASPTQEFPTCSQGVASKDSPRQGSEREEETEPFLGVLEIDPSQSTCSLRAWDSSTFLNSEVSNKEPEKQQVTDKSDLESNDECSKAKPQSESPSSRKGSESNSFSGSSTLSKKSIMPELEKLFILELEKWFLYFQQNGKKLDSTRSTHELSSKKTATSSERKVKSNSPSKVTPVTEVHTENKPTELNDSITELPSQGTVGKLNMPGDRSSKISVDSGLGSLERGQSPSLIEEFSDSLQQTPLIVDKLENIFSKLLSVVHNLLKNPASPTHKDVSGGLKLQQHLDSDQREKLYKALSSKMKKKLDSELFLPEYEKLLYLLYVDKREVRLLLSPPGEVEQVCSVLPSEEKEQAQSSSSEEVVRLFQEFFSNQKVSDNYLTSSKDSGVSLGSSSQKSTSDTGSDEDELEASGRSSVSSSPSSESVSSVIEKVRVGSPFSLKGK